MALSEQIRAGWAAFKSAASGEGEHHAQSVPGASAVPAIGESLDPGWRGFYATADLWRTESAVRTVVDYIASKIASLPFHAYESAENGDSQRRDSSAMGRLLASPSSVPGETRYRIFHALIADTLLADRWLCLVEMDAEYDWHLRRIPPSMWSLDVNALGEPARVRVSLSDRSVTYELPDPRVVMSLGFGGDCGTPFPVSDSLRPLLAEARELASYRRSVARNSGRVPAWVSRDKDVQWSSDEARDEFIQGMRAYRKGGGAEGGWPLLEDGMQIHTLDAFKPVDMADLDARKNIEVEVCNAFHVSPENVGFRTGNKSSVQAYKEQLWNIELRPYVVAFEQSMNLALPVALGEPSVWMKANLDAQLRGTTSEQYQALSTATGRPFMATDEARRILDLPVLGEGYGKPITPLNVTEGGQPSPQDGGRTQNAQQGASPNGEE